MRGRNDSEQYGKYCRTPWLGDCSSCKHHAKGIGSLKIRRVGKEQPGLVDVIYVEDGRYPWIWRRILDFIEKPHCKLIRQIRGLWTVVQQFDQNCGARNIRRLKDVIDIDSSRRGQLSHVAGSCHRESREHAARIRLADDELNSLLGRRAGKAIVEQRLGKIEPLAPIDCVVGQQPIAARLPVTLSNGGMTGRTKEQEQDRRNQGTRVSVTCHDCCESTNQEMGAVTRTACKSRASTGNKCAYLATDRTWAVATRAIQAAMACIPLSPGACIVEMPSAIRGRFRTECHFLVQRAETTTCDTPTHPRQPERQAGSA